MGRKVGGAVPLFTGGELGPHLTQCGLGQSLPSYHVASSSRLVTMDISRNWGSWVPIQHIVAWNEAYLHTKWRLDPSNH